MTCCFISHIWLRLFFENSSILTKMPILGQAPEAMQACGKDTFYLSLIKWMKIFFSSDHPLHLLLWEDQKTKSIFFFCQEAIVDVRQRVGQFLLAPKAELIDYLFCMLQMGQITTSWSSIVAVWEQLQINNIFSLWTEVS